MRTKAQVSKPASSKKSSTSVSSSKQSTASPGVVGSKGVKKASVPVQSCSACGILISDEVKALQCDRCQSCDSWKCIDCLDLSADIFDKLLSSPSCSLKWFCESCDRASMIGNVDQSANETKMDSLLALVERLLDKLSAVETKLGDKCDIEPVMKLEAKLRGIEESSAQQGRDFDKRLAVIEEKLSNPVEPRIVAQPATTCGSANEGLIKLAVQEELNKKTQEEKDLEIRRRNIIIYRVPEKKTDNARERREHDETFFKDLLDRIFNMKLHDGEMEKMYRLGHWTDGKDRPLLVGFKNYEQKEQIMTNLRKFKESSIAKFKGVGIAHDLHPNERLEIKNMVEEAKKRHVEEEGDSTENYWFKVVGHGSKKKVIKIGKQSYSA